MKQIVKQKMNHNAFKNYCKPDSSSKHNQKWLYMSDTRKDYRPAIILFTLWVVWIIASPDDTNIKLSKEQEMRCDYQGCQIIDKPQPFSWYNTGE